MKTSRLIHVVAVALALVTMNIRTLTACPFCAAVSQTLRQEMEAMDAVAIGKLVPPKAGSEPIEGLAEFEIVEVLKGEKLVHVKQIVTAPFFGMTKKGDAKFMLLGVDPPELMWSSPLPVTEKAEKYIRQLQKLPTEPIERLKFFQSYFEDEDSLLARDAYDEFANASYAEVKLLKPHMNREQLIKWINDPALSPDRKRLYLTMLGVCGSADDTPMLEEALKSTDPAKRSGMDAMIGCYLTLKGDAGLPLIEELFLKNRKCEFADVYSAIMALRFHGTEGGVIDRSKIVSSMQYILDRPELADLVIPDLARWEDWSQIDRLVELFKKSDENTSWVRVPVINYLRSCPLPVAKEKLTELEKMDPVSAKRAATFFPATTAPAPGKSDSSFWTPPAKAFFGEPVMIASLSPSSAKKFSTQQSTAASTNVLSTERVADTIRRRDPSEFASADPAWAKAMADDQPGANLWALVSVAAMAGTSLWMVMWLTISGAGHRSLFSQLFMKPARRGPTVSQS